QDLVERAAGLGRELEHRTTQIRNLDAHLLSDIAEHSSGAARAEGCVAKLDRAVEMLRGGPVADITKDAVLDRRGDPKQAFSGIEWEGGERTYELEIGGNHPPAANRGVEPLDGAARHLARGQVTARGDGGEAVGTRGKIESRQAA